MADISRFYGVVIKMYLVDHAPAHLHAVYGENEALLALDTLDLFRGNLPRRAAAMVLEWAALHREELRTDWTLAQAGRPILPIPPLD